MPPYVASGLGLDYLPTLKPPVRTVMSWLGREAQSVTCLATDACLTADPGVQVRSRSGPILSWRLIMK